MQPNLSSVLVTKPVLPPIGEFIGYVERIWESGILTNNGQFHHQLENNLCNYLGVPFISLTCNGTMALIISLHMLGLKGQVITTPFSFVATTNAISFMGLTPIFVDIESDTFNLNPDKIEDAITSKTSAIVAVHVYGNPCNMEAIESIAIQHNIPVIYDAAHAFGVRRNGSSILNTDYLSVLSFHATKVFNTLEGGAIVCGNKEIKEKVDLIKNFGFKGIDDIILPGINAKMNEVQAAVGIANLHYISNSILLRKRIYNGYKSIVNCIAGLRTVELEDNVDWNYSYFPIIIEKEFPITCAELYNRFRSKSIFVRRYFYPLISNLEFYSNITSARKENLPVANEISENVICLPLHPSLSPEDQHRVIDELLNAARA